MSEDGASSDKSHETVWRNMTWPEAAKSMLIGSLIVFVMHAGWDWMLDRKLDFLVYIVKAILLAGFCVLVMSAFPLVYDRSE